MTDGEDIVKEITFFYEQCKKNNNLDDSDFECWIEDLEDRKEWFEKQTMIIENFINLLKSKSRIKSEVENKDTSRKLHPLQKCLKTLLKEKRRALFSMTYDDCIDGAGYHLKLPFIIKKTKGVDE